MGLLEEFGDRSGVFTSGSSSSACLDLLSACTVAALIFILIDLNAFVAVAVVVELGDRELLTGENIVSSVSSALTGDDFLNSK